MSPLAAAILAAAEALINAEGPAIVAALAKLLAGQKIAPPSVADQEALARIEADAQARAQLGG